MDRNCLASLSLIFSQNAIDGRWSTDGGRLRPGGIRVVPHPPENPDSILLLIPLDKDNCSFLRVHNQNMLDLLVTALVTEGRKVFGEPH